MTDRQFADLFAIAQVSPGPNVIIVTLIGYQAAGLAGALVATLAMCGPTCLFAFYMGAHLGAVPRGALAQRDPGRPRSGFDRSDRRERAHSGAGRRSQLDRRRGDGCNRSVRIFHPAQSALAVLAAGLIGLAGYI